MKARESHPGPETLAELAEWACTGETSSPSEAARQARRHCESCADCAREVDQASQVFLARSAGGANDPLEPSMRAAALRIHRSAAASSSLSGSSAGPLPGSSPGSPPWWKPGFRPATVGALAAAAVVAAIVFSPFEGPFTGRESLNSPVGFAPAPVLQLAVNQASSQGPILPGTSEIVRSTTYRSANELEFPSELRDYLDTEWRKAESGAAGPLDPSSVDPSSVDPSSVDPSSVDPSSLDPSSLDRVLWLAAGEIASGRLRAARSRLEAEGVAGTLPTDSTSPNALPTDALPTDVLPTDALPTDALPTDALSKDGVSKDAVAKDGLQTTRHLSEVSLEIRRILLLSTIDYRQSRMDAAERRLRQVLEFEPGNEIARFNLGLVLEATDREPEALERIGSLRNSGTPWVRSRAEDWLENRH